MSRRGFEDWQFTGDPAPLARDNIMVMQDRAGQEGQRVLQYAEIMSDSKKKRKKEKKEKKLIIH